MPNTGIDSNLVAATIAAGFDEGNVGEYQLQNLIDSSYSKELKEKNSSVFVPLTPDFIAEDYTPGSAAAAQDITQTGVTITLNKSKRVTYALTDKERSLPGPQLLKVLQEKYALAIKQALVAQVNVDIVAVMAASSENAVIEFSNGGNIAMAQIRAAKKVLDKKKVGLQNRYSILDSDYYNDLLDDSEFKSLTGFGDEKTVEDGVIGRKLGFGFGQNHAMSGVGFCFTKNSVAIAARCYSDMLINQDISVAFGEYKGLPIRVLCKTDDNWNTKIQADILYGIQLVDGKRVQRITEAA